MKSVKVFVKDIISFLGNQVIAVNGDVKGVFIDNLADVAHVNETTLDWIQSTKTNKQEIAEKSVARVILVDAEVKYSDMIQSQNKVLIVVDNPRRTMAEVMEKFFLEKRTSYVHPSVVIHPEANVDTSAYIDAGCVIGKAKIGKNTVIRANVTIYDDVVIGDNCLIQAGAVIGTDGLGCARRDDGVLVKFPHLGGVVIGNNVEIGANCQIAKGALSNTIISDGCKLNGLCFIAHNCQLGRNVWITGNTMLAGSVVVEDNVTIFSSVTVRDQRKIGTGAIIGMGTLVTKDIPAGEVWIGSPAHKLR